MACKAQGQGTIKLVERSTPSLNVRKMASLIALHIPKSSALIINRRASTGYPSRRFVCLLFNRVIWLISCFRYFAVPLSRRPNGLAQRHRRDGPDTFSIIAHLWQKPPARELRSRCPLEPVFGRVTVLSQSFSNSSTIVPRVCWPST